MTERALPTIRYRRNVDDYLAWQRHGHRFFWRGRGRPFHYGVIVFSFFAAVVLLLVVHQYANLPPLLLVVTGVFVYLGAKSVLMGTAAVLVPTWFLAPRERWDIEATSTIEPDGMRTVTPDGESYLLWWAVRGLAETKNYFHFVAERGEAFPIPKRAFADADATAAFAGTVRDRIAASRPRAAE